MYVRASTQRPFKSQKGDSSGGREVFMSYWHEAIAKLNREQVAMFTLKSQRISRAAPQSHINNAGCKDTTVRDMKQML